jgi:uncharacterized membrane protein YkvA (DUF1232 family)
MSQEHDDFYKGLRAKLKKWAETKEGKENKFMGYAMLAPDLFHLLCRLTLEKDVPVEHKAKLAIAIAYFVSPVDLIPDMIPVAGFLDDVALAAYVLNGIVNTIDPKIVKRHWAGDDDILQVTREILKAADDMIGKGLWRKLMNILGKKK